MYLWINLKLELELIQKRHFLDCSQVHGYMTHTNQLFWELNWEVFRKT